MDEALRAKLLANTALAGMVAKIVWDERPESGALPAVVLTLVAPGREYTHDGWDGLDATLVQVDVWAEEPTDARDIAKAIIAAIEPAEEVGGYMIGPCFLESESADTDTLNGKPLFRRRQDWTVMNAPLETTP
jgi:hypothetical protein